MFYDVGMNEQLTETDHPANYLAPDGYRYGVMYNDGSVGEWFNGRTQRERAAALAAADAVEFAPDNITLARKRPGGRWERVVAQFPVPEGWLPFGSLVDYNGPSECSEETGEDGLPLWERPISTPPGE